MTPLIIIGAGGHGAEVAAYAHDMGLPLLGVLDDDKPKGAWHVVDIIGTISDLPMFCETHAQVHYITAVGNNALRQEIVRRIESLNLPNLKPFTLNHTSTWSGEGVIVGEGTLLAPGSLITTRTSIGRHCILNVKASVSHDCVIGDYCNINPGATLCGNVQLGEGCYIGAGATVIEKCKIGAWTIVGAGAVVTEDLPDGVTAVGVPARIIKQQSGK